MTIKRKKKYYILRDDILAILQKGKNCPHKIAKELYTTEKYKSRPSLETLNESVLRVLRIMEHEDSKILKVDKNRTCANGKRWYELVGDLNDTSKGILPKEVNLMENETKRKELIGRNSELCTDIDARIKELDEKIRSEELNKRQAETALNLASERLARLQGFREGLVSLVKNTGKIDEKAVTIAEPPRENRHRKRWDTYDDGYIRQHHGKIPYEEIARRLGRKPVSVYWRADDLGLIQHKKKKQTSMEE